MNQPEPTAIPSQVPPRTAMLDMASSYWLSQCIYVAAKFAIADLLKESSEHCDTLAAATGTHSGSLYRERCQLIGGSFFEAVPAGADAYSNK